MSADWRKKLLECYVEGITFTVSAVIASRFLPDEWSRWVPQAICIGYLTYQTFRKLRASETPEGQEIIQIKWFDRYLNNIFNDESKKNIIRNKLKQQLQNDIKITELYPYNFKSNSKIIINDINLYNFNVKLLKTPLLFIENDSSINLQFSVICKKGATISFEITVPNGLILSPIRGIWGQYDLLPISDTTNRFSLQNPQTVMVLKLTSRQLRHSLLLRMCPAVNNTPSLTMASLLNPSMSSEIFVRGIIQEHMKDLAEHCKKVILSRLRQPFEIDIENYLMQADWEIGYNYHINTPD